MTIGPLLFCALQVVVACYAIWRGGGPERRAALMQVVAFLATMASYSISNYRFIELETGVFAIDVALLIALYWLALRSNRVWPMAMTALQLSSIFVHVARLADGGMSAWAYAFLLKIWGYAMVLLLGVAVVRHRRRLHKSGVDKAWSQ